MASKTAKYELTPGEAEEENTKPITETPQTQPARWTLWLVYSTAVCILGSSLQFGYNTSCINAPEQDIKAYFKKDGRSYSDFEWSATVAIFAIGGMIGALLGPYAANRFGRKNAILANNIPAIAASLLMFLSYFAKSSAMLIIGRLVCGFNSGANTAIIPMYLSEIAPVNLRGSLGTLNQFGVVTGLLLGFVVGLKQLLGSGEGWPYLLGFSIVPAVIQLVTLPWCPKSPRYLLLELNKSDEAIEALRKLRDAENVDNDIEEMKIEQEAESHTEKVKVIQLFKRRDLQMPLFIGIVMQMSQQLGGINAVFYYSTSIFEQVGVPESRVATCGIGIVGLVCTGLTVKLVEVLGRRTLMLYGLGGMFVFYAVMTIAFRYNTLEGTEYVAVIATMVLVLFFFIGPGAIPWFITAEMFAQGPRPAACAVAATVNWFANFIIGLAFPSMQKALYPYTFLVFMGLLAIFWTFTFFFVPETKGKTIEEITSHFRSGGNSRIVFYRGLKSRNQNGNVMVHEAEALE
ncbi:solute carrier family 2, facilitated glucose transporter member 1 [Exaiptasia diaphana]|uniref:Major facilitator superfamily (MFS) profile domain-containing protein n=1 Tax=Exaiptasia diaphana TaxID=2652724 RepID=A0A913Y3Y3_EXADI|nr:solute carrier family 2, facilitated glucose transporter member 1 [Exaiptasia diaphana]